MPKEYPKYTVSRSGGRVSITLRTDDRTEVTTFMTEDISGLGEKRNANGRGFAHEGDECPTGDGVLELVTRQGKKGEYTVLACTGGCDHTAWPSKFPKKVA